MRPVKVYVILIIGAFGSPSKSLQKYRKKSPIQAPAQNYRSRSFWEEHSSGEDTNVQVSNVFYMNLLLRITDFLYFVHRPVF
jgi:hypothetical protein